MRGEVLHFDSEHGFGFINGADGKRYTFEKTDLRRDFSVSKGTLVEFQPDGDNARDLFLIRGGTVDHGTPATNNFGRSATVAEPTDTSLWSYYWRGITENYTNFRARARRKEYWGFYLFWVITAVAIALVGIVIDASLGFLDREEPYVTIGLVGLFFLATFIPFLALAIRRQHDIGLSGWFILLGLIPYIGNLIIFVFSLIPSQKHENKWGPVPYGINT